MTTTVETLRKAAEKLRTVAGEASPSPWINDHGRVIAADSQPMPGMRKKPSMGVIRRVEDADYIAAMHPGVGLALAKTLALDADALEMASMVGEYDPGTGYDDELAIARLILGEQP